MVKRIKRSNIVFCLLLLVGLIGSGYEAFQISKIKQVNGAIVAGQLISDDAYPYLQKFPATDHRFVSRV